MHFLKELIKNPKLEDPPKNNMKIHRHFYRYSKGDFIGPAIKISVSSSKITLKGSHEYEDLIIELDLNSIANNKQLLDIKGTLFSGIDINKTLMEYGLNWDVQQSKGQTKNYKVAIIEKIDKKTLLKLLDVLRENSYFLISFELNPIVVINFCD